MSVDEATRHHLYTTLEEWIGPQDAEALMESLPPLGWGDVPSKQYIDQRFETFEARFDHKLEALEARFDHKLEALEARFDHKFEMFEQRVDYRFGVVDERIELLGHQLSAAFRREINRQTVVIMTLTTALAASFSSFAVAFAR